MSKKTSALRIIYLANHNLFNKLQVRRSSLIPFHTIRLHDNVTDTDDDSDLVAEVDPDTLIRIVRTELKNGKAPGVDNVYNIILKKAIGTGFYKVLVRAFTISLKLGFILHVMKVAVLCVLIKPDKQPSQTTSYRHISLLSAIMKLSNGSSKNVFENIFKTTISLTNTIQALGNPSQQMTISFFSLRPSWKASILANM